MSSQHIDTSKNTIRSRLSADIAATRKLECEVTVDDIAGILETTIKADHDNALITFLTMILTYTDQDQQNIAFGAESSTGKSYIPLQIAPFFPACDVMELAYSSPTSFFHDYGVYDSEHHVVNIDLRQKILVFVDMPHMKLLERLRPLLSHDRLTLRYKITDRTQKSGQRTKNVVIHGFPTVIFCTSHPSLNNQEKTRLVLLSPDTTQDKIRQSILLTSQRLGDRVTFHDALKEDPKRQWLRERIAAIRDQHVDEIVIPECDQLAERFLSARPHLRPRHMRDFPKLLALIKAHALLNCFHRDYQHAGEGLKKIITANHDDIEAGWELYHHVAQSNEIGVTPEQYVIYRRVLEPHPEGLDRKQFHAAYFQSFHRPITPWRLEKIVLPNLMASGLVAELRSPEDRRVKLYVPQNNISANRGGTDSPLYTTLQEYSVDVNNTARLNDREGTVDDTSGNPHPSHLYISGMGNNPDCSRCAKNQAPHTRCHDAPQESCLFFEEVEA